MAQQRLEGAVRFIVTPGEPDDVPPEWSAIPTIDATSDYPRAREKLLLHVSNNGAMAGEDLRAPFPSPEDEALFAPPTTPPVSNSMTAPPPLTPHPSDVVSFSYDRPPQPPSHLARLRRMLRYRSQDLLFEHKRLVVALSLLILLALLGSGAGWFLLRPGPVAHHAQPVVQIPVYGQVSFESTSLEVSTSSPHTLDEVEVALNNLKTPAKGNSYYAWLLPGLKNARGSTIALGQVSLDDQENAHLMYTSPNQSNLLAEESRFLITEEPTSPQPVTPTADQSRWRYAGAIPQSPNPDDSSHLSALDHLRHLLANGPISMMKQAGSLPGGLGFGFLQSTRQVFSWAQTASTSDSAAQVAPMRADLIRILDALDGGSLVHLDVPQGTPMLYHPKKPLLTLDPNAMVPGYVHDIDEHLLAFASSPGVTAHQRTLVGTIDAELNQIGLSLGKARDDAKQLTSLSDQDLPASSAVSLLDDLSNQLLSVYLGQLNVTTGFRQGGALSVFDHLQQLAQIPITAYSS